jgi:tetratricopeptide (TPR) repeat protein
MNIFDLWDFGDAAASEERFREAADEAADDEAEGLALTQLARAQGLQGKFEQARESLAHAKRLIGDEGSAADVQYFLELGRVENSSGNAPAAMPHFAEALRLAQALNADYAALDAAHMVAIASPPELQVKNGLKALELARACKDDKAKRWIGPIVNNLGWSYMDLNQPAEALPYFRESLEFRITQGTEAPIRMARYSLGCVLRTLGELQEALAVQREALAMGGSVGYIEEEIGECLFALGQPEEARSFFAEAHAKLSANTDLATSEPERMARILQRS